MLDPPSNLVCELTASYRVAFLVPALCIDLPSQSVPNDATGTSIPTWSELLRGYPGNFWRAHQLLYKAKISTTNAPTIDTRWRLVRLVVLDHPVRRDP